VRRKNVLGTIMHSFFIIGVVTIVWATVAIASPSARPRRLIGDLSWAGLHGVGADANKDYAATIPHLAFMIFQCMFAVITPR